MKARTVEAIARESAAVARGEMAPGRVWIVEKRADGTMERRQASARAYQLARADKMAMNDKTLQFHREAKTNSVMAHGLTVAVRAAGSDKRIYVERRSTGDYAVRRPNSERASAVAPTQKEAIERARELAPRHEVHVERVRHTDAGGPDKWRKA